MISLWVFIREADVEAYAGTLILPSYLSHLQLGPFQFAVQAENCDGQEPLKLTYLGEGRLEEYTLFPEEHALPLIQFVCPDVAPVRIQLPRDDAAWHWASPADSPQAGDPAENMRIYFAPTVRTLHGMKPQRPAEDAYVSVSRGHVFIGRRIVESYLVAWLDFLGIRQEVTRVDFATPSAGIEFVAGVVGGQMFLSDEVLAEDLMRFAGLEKAWTDLGHSLGLDLDFTAPEGSGIFDDGIYIKLSQPADQAEVPEEP
ncbi:hypothetical protein HQ535_04315 [bacterium]|nr:hypothetical protein [bacterium]